MTQEEILIGNELIGGFMGLDILYGGFVKHESAGVGKVTKMKYHDRWDWLMDVWLKILQWGTLKYGDYWVQEITQNQVRIDSTKAPKGFNCMYRIPAGSLEIGDVWLTVVQFIEWYNEQSK